MTKAQHEGRRAKEWREAMGFPMDKLAELMNVSTQTIRRMEAARRVPVEYRLACAAISASLNEWEWQPSPAMPLPRSVARAIRIAAEALESVRE